MMKDEKDDEMDDWVWGKVLVRVFIRRGREAAVSVL